MSETRARRTWRGLAALVAWLPLAAASGAVVAATAASGSGVLDGKTFVGSVGPQGGKRDGDDTITFDAGSFRSLACDKYGFGGAAYTTTASEDGSVRFHAVTTSAREGTIEWSGVVHGDALTGTFEWKTKRGKVSSYWVEATAKTAAAKAGRS